MGMLMAMTQAKQREEAKKTAKPSPTAEPATVEEPQKQVTPAVRKTAKNPRKTPSRRVATK